MTMENIREFLWWLNSRIQLAGWPLLAIILTTIFILIFIIWKLSKIQARNTHSQDFTEPPLQPECSPENQQQAQKRIESMLKTLTDAEASVLEIAEPPKRSVIVVEQPQKNVVENIPAVQNDESAAESSKKPRNSSAPLDIQELKAVAMMAKQLHLRTHNHIHN